MNDRLEVGPEDPVTWHSDVKAVDLRPTELLVLVSLAVAHRHEFRVTYWDWRGLWYFRMEVHRDNLEDVRTWLTTALVALTPAQEKRH